MAMREKLIELLAEHCSYKKQRCVGCDTGKHYHPECKTERFGKIADHLIANGVTTQKHGRWKGAGMGDYLCSECWETFSGGDRFRYCPGCGAKMLED